MNYADRRGPMHEPQQQSVAGDGRVCGPQLSAVSIPQRSTPWTERPAPTLKLDARIAACALLACLFVGLLGPTSSLAGDQFQPARGNCFPNPNRRRPRP